MLSGSNISWIYPANFLQKTFCCCFSDSFHHWFFIPPSFETSHITCLCLFLFFRVQWTIKQVFSQNPLWRSSNPFQRVTQKVKVETTRTAAYAAHCSPHLELKPGLFGISEQTGFLCFKLALCEMRHLYTKLEMHWY